ncbi:hypothetical protein [Sneathiella glossodoripedis]|uniref:hypothetical protein n=1 Tax=Sneathiella glossodoripedis TaxID=418853 RepID=UPI0004715B85|nr:hypothetical protein [Sneathiella glossodoripedis]
MKLLLKSLLVAAGAAVLFAAPASAVTYNATAIYADIGTRTDGDDNQAGRDNPSNALGASDGDFWSMGRGGISVFAFNPPGSFNEAVMTIEETYNCNSVNGSGNCSNYAENAELYVYSGAAVDFTPYEDGTFGPNNETVYDLDSWFASLGLTMLDTIGNGEANENFGGYSYDLSGLGGSYLYVILRDASNSPDGFDVKSVSVSVVPLPPAVALFGAALGMMGWVARRKRKALAA